MVHARRKSRRRAAGWRRRRRRSRAPLDDLTRLQGIAAKTQGRGVSRQDLDRAQSAVVAASSRTDELRDALHLVESGSRSEDIAGAEAQVKASRAQLALLRHQIELGELKAPVDAVVRSRCSNPGTWRLRSDPS